ncbi:hypothetical protein JCM3766R1_003291 [Sporobolomyces carnicolor]
MPKSSKHKKERAADFKKAKLKLGKGKQIANNATNTSFSAKTIALPNQSLHEAPKDVPTSRRNLTMTELLVQSRHYSVPVKREAINEIDQLVKQHPYLIHEHLLAIVTSIAHLVADASPSVRHATLDLLRDVADALPGPALVSVSQGLVLFTLSALSNLDESIRIDALKVLDLLLDKIPDEIVRGFDGSADVHAQLAKGSTQEHETGPKVVEGLLGMLKIRNPALTAAQGTFTSAASSSDLSPSARLAVLTTLATFLRTSMSPVASTSTAPPPWYLAASFETPRAYSSFVGSTTSKPPRSSRTVVDVEHTRSAAIERFASALPYRAGNISNDLALSSLNLFAPPPSTTFANDDTNPIASTSSAPSTTPTTLVPQTLLSLVHPTLVSSFLDAAPSAFSPTPVLGQSATVASAELATISAVLRVARELFYRDLGNCTTSSCRASSSTTSRQSARKQLVALLHHAAPYFPFGGDELHARTTAEDDQLLQLNLTFSELVSLLVLSSQEEAGEDIENRQSIGGGGNRNDSLNQKKKKQKKVDKAHSDASRLTHMVSNVQEWVVAALECRLTSSSHPLGRPPLSLEAFVALEPTLWSLLNRRETPGGGGGGGGGGGVEQVWKSVLIAWGKMPRESEARRRVFEFVATAISVQTDAAYVDRFDLDPSVRTRECVEDTVKWVVGLAKWLWELGAKQIDTTELVIDFLLRLAQQDENGILPTSALEQIAPVLVPFFHLSHPTRGALAGPFTRLSQDRPVQAKCLDLASYLVKRPSGGGASLREAVERAVRSKGVDEGLRKRWTNESEV